MTGGRTFGAVVAACAVLTVLSLLMTVWYAAHVNSDRRADQIASCERGNIQRRTINEIVAQLQLDMQPLVVPVCEDIIR